MKIIAHNNGGLLKDSVQSVTIETNDGCLELPAGGNLLDVLLANGYAIEYQCRGGYCGSCRLNMIQGKITYNDLPLAHLNDDEVLPCCCQVTESIKLDIERTLTIDNQEVLFE